MNPVGSTGSLLDRLSRQYGPVSFSPGAGASSSLGPEAARMHRISQCLNNMSSSERQTLEGRMEQINTRCAPDRAILDFFLALIDTPAADQEDVIRRVDEFFEQRGLRYGPVFLCDKWPLLEVLGRCPSSDRDDVTSRTDELCAWPMSGEDIREVFFAVRRIPADDRDDVMSHVRLLINPQMDGWHMAQVLGSVGAIPAVNRPNVLSAASGLSLWSSPQISGDAKAKILGILNKVPVADRDDLIQCMNFLYGSVMSGIEYVRVLDSLKRIPTDQRQDMVRHARTLFECVGQMALWEQEVILEALKRTPPLLRGKVVEGSVALISPSMSRFEQRWIIEALSKERSEQGIDIFVARERDKLKSFAVRDER